MSDHPTKSKRGASFWFVIASVFISLFLSAFDFTGVSTALPTIAQDLHGENWVWVGSGYALASSALLPLSGGLSEVLWIPLAFVDNNLKEYYGVGFR